MEKIITIDGGAGTGKTTIAHFLSKKLNYQYVSSGLIYRKLAYFFIENNALDLEIGLEKFKREEFNLDKKINWKKLTKFLESSHHKYFSQEVSKKASEISQFDYIRNFVNQILKTFSREGKIIFEGRDMGSVVFPEANVKIFLTVDAEVAAERRKKQFNFKDQKEIMEEIQKRDKEDKEREIAPLIAPKNALIFDTSHLKAKEAANKLYEMIINQL